MASTKVTIQGTVTLVPLETVYGLGGLRVELWDGSSSNSLGRISAAITDDKGGFNFTLDGTTAAGILGGSIPPHYKVYQGNTLLVEDDILYSTAPVSLTVDATIYDDKVQTEPYGAETPKTITFYGYVRDLNNSGYEGLFVRVYELGMREKFLLGEAVSDKSGNYNIRISTRTISNTDSYGKRTLKVEAYDDADSIVAYSMDITDWPSEINVDLVAGALPANSHNRFDILSGLLTDVAGSVDVATLTQFGENGTNEIRYAADATGQDQEEIFRVVKAKAYAGESGLDAPMLFALIKQQGHDQNPVEIMPEAEMRAAITAAADIKAINPPSETEINSFIANAKLFQIDKTRDAVIRNEEYTVGDVLDGIFGDSIDVAKFLRLSNVAYTSAAAFWNAYKAAYHQPGSDDPGPIMVAKAQRGLRLATITGFQPLMVGNLMSEVGDGVQALATWSEADWIAYLDEIAEDHPTDQFIPKSVRGGLSSHNAEAISLYAKKLKAVTQNLYPLTTIRGELEGSEGHLLIPDNANRSDAMVFIANNPEFDLRINSVNDVSHFVTTGVSSITGLKAGLAPLQRLLQVTGGAPEAVSVMKIAGLDSAYSILEKGEPEFIEAFAEVLGGEEQASFVYGKASAVNAIGLELTLEAVQKWQDVSLNVFPQNFPNGQPADPQKDPTLAALFGSLDYCACRECLSLFSPAAYLTDLLNFLRKNAFPAYEELTRRRPDLPFIDLSCKNTNTVLPYIDLANELLEDESLRFNGVAVTNSYQTQGTTLELAADPEHIKRVGNAYVPQLGPTSFEQVYNAYLPQSVYPQNLPFSLPVEETRTYLKHLAVSRLDAMRLFFPHDPALVTTSVPTNEITAYSVFAEWLGLIQESARIVTDTSGNDTYKYYGLPGTTGITILDPTDSSHTLTGDWDALLSKVYVLLYYGKISYKELLQLLNTDFLNPVVGGVRGITITPADTCDLTKLNLTFGTGINKVAFFAKLHRYVRLIRTNKFSIYELDTLLRTLKITSLDIAEFQRLGRAVALAERMGMPAVVLGGWWNSLDIHHYTDFNSETLSQMDSVYDGIFRNKMVINTPLNPFPANGDFSGLSTVPEYGQYRAMIATACGIGEKDLDAVLQILGIALNDDMSLAGLSRIYALGRAAAGTGLKAADLSRLMQVLDYPTMMASSDITDLGDNTAVTGIFSDPSNSAGVDIRLDMLRILLDYAAALRTAGMSMPEVDYLVSNIDRTGKSDPSPLAIKLFYEDLRADLQKMPLYVAPGELIPYTQRIYQHFSKEFGVPFEWVQPALDTAVIEQILDASFVTSDSATTLSEATLLTNFNNSEKPDIALYDTYRRVFKWTTIASKIGASSVDFWNLVNEVGPGWDSLPVSVEFGAVPPPPEETPILAITVPVNPDVVLGLLRMSRWMQVKRELKFSDKQLNKLLKAAEPGAEDKTTWLYQLGTALPAATVNLLADGTYPSANLLKVQGAGSIASNRYGNISLILAMADIVSMVTRTGLAADAIQKTLRADLVMNDAHSVLLAARSKYNDVQWSKIAKPLRDELRRRQRTALAGYILAHPKSSTSRVWLTENDLFAFLLIDVEMDSCMKTSRIKQAINSVQLFVDRLLLGIERSGSTILTMAPRYVKQWELWRKWYRVWEANRKIFLYPENWIEPELRDGKSQIFEELETQLKQDDLTHQLAEDAVMSYLTRLGEVARLEPVATCDYFDVDTQMTTVHAFARTYGEPQHYFYRRLVNDEWTPWGRIDFDIKSEHVMTIVWNRKLYLIWLTFVDKRNSFLSGPDAPGRDFGWSMDWLYNKQNATLESEGALNSDGSARKTVRQDQVEVSLNWSEYKENKWLKQKVGKNKVTLNVNTLLESAISIRLNGGGYDRNFLNFLTNDRKRTILELFKSRLSCKPELNGLTNELHIGIYIPRWITSSVSEEYPTWLAGFSWQDATTDPLPGYVNMGSPYRYYSPTGTISSNNRFLENNVDGVDRPLRVDNFSAVSTAWMYVYREEKFDSLPAVYKGTPDRILKTTDANGAFRLVAQSNYRSSPLENLFFFEDKKNTFFVRWRRPGLQFNNLVVTENAITLVNAGGASSGIFTPPVKANAGPKPPAIDNTYTGNTPAAGEAYVPIYYFQTFYHPHITRFLRTLNQGGIDALLRLEMQVQTDGMDFKNKYDPTTIVNNLYPTDKVDFDYWGPYSCYNWELFFHIPMLIAQRLSENQKFADARKWFHYVFDPTSTQGLNGDVTVKRFWRCWPLYQVAGQPVQTLQDLLTLINNNNTVMVAQVAKWEDNPFKPHVVARMRLMGYMKYVVMKYLDNLIAWGDQLFTRDTIESINEATQLYILAGNILGRRPTEIAAQGASMPKNFVDLVGSGTLDAFSNARVAMENYVNPNTSSTPSNTPEPHPTMMLYFCLSRNEKLMGYWDTVADRLFKIRNCMNISGQVRELPLFEPPIDPALLVRAAAAGVSVDSVLNSLYGGTSAYRFSYVLAKANEFCADVRALGGSLLAALEKKDAEHLALLRSVQEIGMLERMTAMKQSGIDEAQTNLDGLLKQRENTEMRQQYYATRPFMNDKEQEQMRSIQIGMVLQGVQGAIEGVAAVVSNIPTVHVQGISSGASTGGPNIANGLKAVSAAIGIAASINTGLGTMAGTMGSYDRRQDDWTFQASTASKELEQIDKQILAGEIRLAIAQKDLDNHLVQIENSRETDEYMRSKFTNEQLYSWMSAQLSSTYFQAYQMAFKLAAQAEQCYIYELPISKQAAAGFVQNNYYDSLKKGLLAGEKLQYDMRRMEVAYMSDNGRELELTKHISLALTMPGAILELRETGKCTFAIPEALYDLDFPGQYYRRIKSVSISIPCVTGPYTTVNARLTLQNHWLRSGETIGAGLELGGGIATNHIATSSGQNDAGVFELNFRDERYVPFEGAGAVSTWKLDIADLEDQLDEWKRQAMLFDLDSISDVIMHIRYTAREGAESYRKNVIIAVNNLLKNPTGDAYNQLELPRFFSLKHEFPNEWYAYAQTFQANPEATLQMMLRARQFPFFAQGKTINITSVSVLQRSKAAMPGVYKVAFSDETDDWSIDLSDFGGSTDVSGLEVDDTTLSWQLIKTAPDTPKSMDELLDDLLVVVYYKLS